MLQQLLTENVLLAIAGCGFGLALAFWGTRLFALIVPSDFPELLRHRSMRGCWVLRSPSRSSSLLFGLMPALRASRVDLNEVLKEGARGSSGGRRRGRNLLLVAEVALSMVLLVGAGLMMRGFLRERRPARFDTKGLLTADVLLGGFEMLDKTPQDADLVAAQSELFYDQLLERVRALPGVTRAGIISRLPLDVWTHPFTIVGRPAPEPGKEPQADLNEVDAQALDTLGIRLLRGRMIQGTRCRRPGSRSSTRRSPIGISRARIRSRRRSA